VALENCSTALYHRDQKSQDVCGVGKGAGVSLMGLASCVSPLGLSENNALYYELMDTLLRADEAGIVFEDDLRVVRIHQLIDTLAAQLRTDIA
jgi:hypothetical protein